MGNLACELKGGQAPGSFECTGCKRSCIIGYEYLEIHVAGGLFGPLCVDCWPKVPKMFELVASRPGVSVDIAAMEQQVMARYQAAKARGN